MLDYQKAADQLGWDLATIQAVADVESAGDGFWGVGKPKVLYERHRMYKALVKKIGLLKTQEIVRQSPNLVNPVSGGYTRGSASEQRRVEQARLIDKNLGLESASWGRFQILGEHWKFLGFGSVVDFVLTMSRSDQDQLDIFVRFIRGNPRLQQAGKDHDWPTFARWYNGKRYRDGDYDGKLRRAYKRFS